MLNNLLISLWQLAKGAGFSQNFKRKIKDMKIIIRPKVTCGAVIERNSKILLTERNIRPYKNFWCLPGGNIDWGEKVEEAIKREVREETGLDFKPEFFRYYDEIIPKIKWHAVSLFFIGGVDGIIKIDRNEVKEFRWFSEKEIRKLKLAFTHKQVVEDYFILRRLTRKQKHNK